MKRDIGQYLTINVDTRVAKLVIAFVPLVGSAAILWLRNSHRGAFNLLFQEDSVFEYLTSVCYLVSAAISVLLANSFWKNKSTKLATAYGLLAVGMFFVAAEEISWGQRLLNIETPQVIAEHNTQGELTIHNLRPIQQVLHGIYVAVGAYGAFLWIAFLIGTRSLSLRAARYVVPGWYIAPYFLPVFVLYAHIELATRETAWFRYQSPDQEPTEFILSLGFLLFVVGSWLRQHQELGIPQPKWVNASWSTDRT